jgi:ligand-binding sensor domain-containing protein
MYESPDGTLWLGTKPDGLFRLHQTASNAFRIDHLNMQIDNRLSISRKLVGSVYNVTQDRYGRLWVATLGGGLCYTTEPQADVPHFIAPAHYPEDKAQRVRYLKITSDGYLLAATTEGLMAARLEQDADKIFLIWRPYLHGILEYKGRDTRNMVIYLEPKDRKFGEHEFMLFSNEHFTSFSE